MMGFGGIGILLIIAAVFFIWKLFPYQNVNSAVKNESALDILKKRFANGDISKEEFEQKKKTLI